MCIVAPNIPEKPDLKLTGQRLQLSSLPPDIGIKALKALVHQQLPTLPPGRQKLLLQSGEKKVVMQDTLTLAHFCVEDGTEIHIGIKERGGRR